MGGAAEEPIEVEWRHGSWRLAGGGAGLGTVRSLAELQRTRERGQADGSPASPLVLVLPRSVQRLLDEARALDDAGLTAAASAARGGAARLLRSKRMRDDDIAHCLALPLDTVRAHLPAAH